MDVPMELSRILITELGEQQIIVLREIGGQQRTFPIMIGITEAMAIDRRIKGILTPRPMTHELLSNAITALGAELEKIVITDIRDHTFIAAIHLRRDGLPIVLDSRPSDAVALGAAFNTPIFVADQVLDGVCKSTATKEDRLAILRERLVLLQEKMIQLMSMLDDKDFVAGASEQAVCDARDQLEQLRKEYDAIEQVLRKVT